MKLKKVVIIGTGLIGGSIGKALLQGGIAEEVVGVCRRRSSLERALREKVVTSGFVGDYASACQDAEMIFISTPVHIIIEVLDRLGEVLSGRDAIVTDAGSTKMEVVEHARAYSDKFHFVGGHPVAGSEKTGPENADAGLFRNALCVVTKDDATSPAALEKVYSVWAAIGANVEVMSPGDHDNALALTSHLPHAVAFALAGAQREDLLKYASSGFRDTTRIAASDPVIWTDIFLSNSKAVLNSIRIFKDVLSGIENDINNGERKALLDKLSICRQVKDGTIREK